MPTEQMKTLYQCDNIKSQFIAQQETFKNDIEQIEAQIASFSWRSEIDI